MREFLLSFDNTQQKRQKELFMEYRTYSIRKQYLFVYQRDGISLDVECFKDLVSFSKKPTRSSLLYLEWVSHREPIRLQNNIISVRNRKPFRFLPVTNLVKVNMRKYVYVFDKLNLANMIFNRYVAKFENFLIEPKLNTNLNIFENLYLNDFKTNKLEIFQNNFYFKDYNLDLYKLEPIKHYREKLGQTFENIMAQDSHEKFLNDFDILFSSQKYIANYFGFDPVTINTKTVMNIERTEMFNRENKYGFIIRQFMAKDINPIYHMTLFNEPLLGLPFKRHLNLYEETIAKMPPRTWSLFENINAYGSDSNRIVNDMNADFYQKYNGFHTNIIDNIYAKVSDKIIKENTFDALRFTHERIVNEVSLNTLVYKTVPYSTVIYNETLFGDKYASSYLSYYNHNENFLRKFVNNVYTSDFVINGFKDKQNILIDDSTNSLTKNLDSELTVQPYYMAKKYPNDLFVRDENNFVNKYNILLSVFNNSNMINKYPSGLFVIRNEDFIDNIRKGVSVFNAGINIYKKRNGVFLSPQTDFVLRPPIDTAIYDRSIYSITKIVQGLSIIGSGTSLDKKLNELHSLFPSLFIDKVKGEIRYNNNIDSLQKTSATMFLTINNYYMQKFIHKIFLENHNVYALKEYRDTSFSTDYIHDIAKSYLPLMLNTSSDKVLVPINKINKPLFTKDLLESVYKQRGNVLLTSSTDSIFANKGFKDIFSLDNLFCDKLSRDTAFISLVNESLIKNQIRTWFVNEDVFVSKGAHGVFTSTHDSDVIKGGHPISVISDYIWLNKLAKDSVLHNKLITFQKSKTLFEKDTFVSFIKFKSIEDYPVSQEEFSVIKHVFFHQDEQVYKLYKDVYADKKDLLAERPIRDMGILPTGESLHIDRFLYMNQLEQIARVNNFPMEFYEQYFLSRDMFLDLIPGYEEIAKIIKEANITTDAALDWAWTYHEDEPFDDPFKIDELLLPENDSRYEDFENIIFNRETGKPRNPIQIIDDYTFIAKYPIHYPIKDEDGENAYKNIAVEYLDVRTSIMKRVFLGYYQLWQDHIFEFSRMTIPQSAKKILDYLYAWIFMSFAEEDIPEALRVFRLVRWYLERGIIETSEYCIRFEPGDITCKMTTTQLEVPCDLYPTDDTPPNNSMFVDTNLHVIRNNPNRLHREAHFTMYIDNKKDTLVSFSLHTLTPVYIILNEELDNEEILDSITIPTTGKMVYNIPYTGDINTLTIRKHGVDNNDNEFYIGYINIPGLNNKDGSLEIDFNPSKIQGNKVLNYVSQKVMAYTNMFVDNEEIIKELVKGNIHLGEVYEHLLEYWNLHWQNKDKGKRLTIKRT